MKTPNWLKSFTKLGPAFLNRTDFRDSQQSYVATSDLGSFGGCFALRGIFSELGAVRRQSVTETQASTRGMDCGCELGSRAVRWPTGGHPWA